MKKFFIFLPILLLSLVGCGEKSGTLVCTLSSNDVINGYKLDSNYKINYFGKTVKSVETIETVVSDSSETIDYFETTLNNTYKKMNDSYGGYVYNVTKEDGKVVSNVTIDYSKVNIEQLVDDQPLLKSYVDDNKLLLEGLKSMYESMGATCE